MGKLGIFAAIIIAVSVNQAYALGFGALASHRAVYNVQLIEAEDRSGIESMNGRIVYELIASECQGVSTTYRFVTQISTGRDTFVTDMQSASHESADGREYFFTTKSFVNDQQDQNINGNAVRDEGGITVTLKESEDRVLELGDALFTTAHLLAVLKSAKAGEAFVRHSIFDGVGDADKLLNSATVIGKEKTVADQLEGEGGNALQSLREAPAWPITMSYFDANADNSAEVLPIYESSFLLYETGITRDLTMQYSDYSLKATLSEIEYLDGGECD